MLCEWLKREIIQPTFSNIDHGPWGQADILSEIANNVWLGQTKSYKYITSCKHDLKLINYQIEVISEKLKNKASHQTSACGVIRDRSLITGEGGAGGNEKLDAKILLPPP